MDARLEGLLAHAAHLERRDEELADATDRIVELAGRVGRLRERATLVATALAAMPDERAVNDEARAAARVAEDAAADELTLAEERVTSLERSRRRRDDLDQARRELTRARDDLADARARSRRVADRRAELLDEDRALRAEADSLAVQAAALAADLAATPRLPVLGNAAADAGLVGIETWGGRARGALLVARGGLDTERERLVTEANTLGAAVLAEPLGASSVALVRRRLEQALGV